MLSIVAGIGDQYERRQFSNSRPFRVRWMIGLGGMMMIFPSIFADIIAGVGVFIGAGDDIDPFLGFLDSAPEIYLKSRCLT